MRSQPTSPRRDPTVPLRQRLRDALTTAIKSRDRVAIAALRSTLAAIDNAETVDRPSSVDRDLAIERIPTGVGATEVARRTLTQSQIEQIVSAELASRREVVGVYEQAGKSERADRLRYEIGVITQCVEGAVS